MKGLFHDGATIQLRTDLPTPVPAPGEVVLDVQTVGVCDTDLQLAKGYMGFRGVLGHEFVGRTKAGHRVAAEINNACHACPICLAGHPGHCPSRSVLGILNHDGAMAEQVCVPERNLHLIPDQVDDRSAVFIEPLAAAFRITEQIEVHSGLRFAVLGDGKLGLLCTWVARLAGACVSLIGKHPEKLALAGAHVDTRHLNESASLAKSFDVVVDCTGSNSGLETALGLVKPCGTIVLKTTVAGQYNVNLAGIVIDEVRVIGSRCGPFPRAINALANREINVKPLIGHEFSLDEAERAFRAAGERGAKKVLIHVVPPES